MRSIRCIIANLLYIVLILEFFRLEIFQKLTKENGHYLFRTEHNSLLLNKTLYYCFKIKRYREYLKNFLFQFFNK